MGNRRRARELALQTLFAIEFQPDDVEGAINHMEARALGDRSDAEGDPSRPARVDRDVESFAETLVRGVVDHRDEIDELLGRCSTNWKVPRMARVDRNILRMATFELRYQEDIPPKVTLNEAIEIAKRFGSEDSGSFINGILDRIASLTK